MIHLKMTHLVNLQRNYKLLIFLSNLVKFPPCESFQEKVRAYHEITSISFMVLN